MAPKGKAKAKGKARSRSSSPAPRDPTAIINKSIELHAGILACFRRWDADGNGSISLPELKAVLLDIGVEESEIPKLFSLADVNKDGQIDYEEFVAWLYAVAPDAVRKSPRAGREDQVVAALEKAERPATVSGGHPDMRPMPLTDDDREVEVTCKLAAPVTPLLDFTIKVAPSTRLSEIANRICENHGGSIKDPTICINRFHPEEVRSLESTLEECGVRRGRCVVYYDYVAAGGELLGP